MLSTNQLLLQRHIILWNLEQVWQGETGGGASQQGTLRSSNLPIESGDDLSLMMSWPLLGMARGGGDGVQPVAARQ